MPGAMLAGSGRGVEVPGLMGKQDQRTVGGGLAALRIHVFSTKRIHVRCGASVFSAATPIHAGCTRLQSVPCYTPSLQRSMVWIVNATSPFSKGPQLLQIGTSARARKKPILHPLLPSHPTPSPFLNTHPSAAPTTRTPHWHTSPKLASRPFIHTSTGTGGVQGPILNSNDFRHDTTGQQSSTRPDITGSIKGCTLPSTG